MYLLCVGLAVTSALLTALVLIFCKMGLNHIDYMLAETIRTVIVLLFFIGMSYSLGKFEGIRLIDGRSMCFIMLSGVCGAVSWLIYLLAMSLGPVSKVAALEPLSIVFVVLLASFIGEPLTAKSIFAAFLIAGGAMLIAL